MPNDSPKLVKVQVILKSEKPIDFTIESTDLPTDPNGDLMFNNDHHPGFHVEFELIDQTGLKYSFPPNSKKDSAVWSKLGSTNCPTAGVWEVFKPLHVSPDGAKLTVHNTNEKPVLGRFMYSLQVSKDGGNKLLSLDPGGLNNNGPTSRGLSATVAFVAGAAAGSLLTLGAQTLLNG